MKRKITSNPRLMVRAMLEAERKRQIEVEGYTPDKDANYQPGTLMCAGMAYEFNACKFWPWEKVTFKYDSTRSVRMLVKAGALYMAEFDRIKTDLYTLKEIGAVNDRILRIENKLQSILYPKNYE